MALVEGLVGRVVEGWHLTELIGRGADGIVYAGRKSERDAAVKLFFPEPLGKNGLSSARERLELQLALIGKKHHPNLVEIFEGGICAELETLYLAMELVPGKSADQLTGCIPPAEIRHLAKQLASVAKFLEIKELVHRDIKPANIVISDDFKTLTLLDLSIVHQLPAEDDDQGRLSGAEFVATLRYSPPEFVWRTEEENVDGAWRAITFYQIGATLHDMIMGEPLFAGYDVPRARLYDSVRERTPQIASSEVPSELIRTIEACLLKKWRQRLEFVSWESFGDPTVGDSDSQHQEKRIRLRQLRNEEIRQAAVRQSARAAIQTREHDLWQLNTGLILEIRAYMMSCAIFPKWKMLEDAPSEQEYVTRLQFDPDAGLGFAENVAFRLTVSIDPQVEQATRLSFMCTVDETIVSECTWTEMFTVDAAFLACQKSILDAVESMLGS